MTEERKRELRQLLEEAKQSLEIRLLLGDGAFKVGVGLHGSRST